MGRRVSVHDVAAHAGVSVGTVSHALNHPDRLAPGTLEKVQTAIDELGFIRSGSARQLRAGHSSTVGLIVQRIDNPFYVEAAQAIEAVLADADLAMLLCASQGDERRQARALQTLLEQQVRGVIIAAEVGATEMVAKLTARGVRTVLMDSPGTDESVPTVGVDDVAGGRLAVEHLLSLGHRRVGVLMGPADVRQSLHRWEGAQEAAREAGLDPTEVLVLINGDSFTADAGAAGMTSLLDQHPDVTACFCGNDQMAIGAMRVLRQRGHHIPERMALVGYDDIPVAAQLITPLTSVHQPLLEIGRTAAELVLGDGDRQHVLFAPELVVRASTSDA